MACFLKNNGWIIYRPFLEHLETSLAQRFELTEHSIPAGLECNISERGRHPATIQSWCFECKELRKARYIYIDAGKSAQIFNNVIYPAYKYDLPLLGIYFLSFGAVLPGEVQPANNGDVP